MTCWGKHSSRRDHVDPIPANDTEIRGQCFAQNDSWNRFGRFASTAHYGRIDQQVGIDTLDPAFLRRNVDPFQHRACNAGFRS